MARILVFKHVAAEPLGTLDPLIRARGHRIRFVNFERHPDARPRVDKYDGLIVLGGPMNIDQADRYPHLATEARAVEQALELGKPVLGICLGAQIIAHALGSRVYPSEQAEIGWYPLTPTAAAARDPVLAPLPAGHPMFQWHGCTFDLPAGAELLATGQHCVNQAFRYGEAGYGFQFHMEMDRALVSRWLSIPGYRDDLASNGEFDIPQIEAATHAHIDALQALADKVFNRFLDLVSPVRGRIALPSR